MQLSDVSYLSTAPIAEQPRHSRRDRPWIRAFLPLRCFLHRHDDVGVGCTDRPRGDHTVGIIIKAAIVNYADMSATLNGGSPWQCPGISTSRTCDGVESVRAGALRHGREAQLQSHPDIESLSLKGDTRNQPMNISVEQVNLVSKPVHMRSAAILRDGSQPDLSLNQVVEPLSLMLRIQDRTPRPPSNSERRFAARSR
jgi:hypothetical protein